MSFCCDQIADHNNLKKKGFILDYSLRIHSGRAERIYSGSEGPDLGGGWLHCVRKERRYWWLVTETILAFGYTVSVGRRDNTGGWLHCISRKEGRYWLSATFFFVVQPMSPHSWWVLPLLTPPPPQCPHRETHSVFFMIPNVDKINDHRLHLFLSPTVALPTPQLITTILGLRQLAF